MRKALILGATGLIGDSLLEQLLIQNEYSQVTIISRRKITENHPKLRQVICELDDMDRYREAFEVDDVYCCLGTTIKKAGTKEQFMKVDYGYPINAAKLAVSEQARQFLIVSAMGAKVTSSIFYNQVKGKMEEDLKDIPFSSIQIFRPSLLLGKRKEFRLGEKIAELLSKPFSKWDPIWVRKYSPIQAGVVAKAMVQMAIRGEKGVHIYESKDIKLIAK